MAKPTPSEPITAIPERASAHPGWWTSLVVVFFTWLGIPFLAVGAAVPWYVFRRRNPELSGRLTPIVRWALAAWVTTVAMVALAGHRAVRSIVFGEDAAAAARAWIDGTGGAAPSWTAMAIATIAFGVTATISPGILGPVAVVTVLLMTAVQASAVFPHSSNVFGACAVALPIWSALLLAGMIVLLEPLGQWGEAKLRRTRSDGAPVLPRKRFVVGAALIAGAFATRLVLAGPLGDLLRRMTLP